MNNLHIESLRRVVKKRTKRARCRGLKKGVIIDRLANGQSAGMIAAVEQVSRGMVYHYKRIFGL